MAPKFFHQLLWLIQCIMPMYLAFWQVLLSLEFSRWKMIDKWSDMSRQCQKAFKHGVDASQLGWCKKLWSYIHSPKNHKLRGVCQTRPHACIHEPVFSSNLNAFVICNFHYYQSAWTFSYVMTISWNLSTKIQIVYNFFTNLSTFFKIVTKLSTTDEVLNTNCIHLLLKNFINLSLKCKHFSN